VSTAGRLGNEEIARSPATRRNLTPPVDSTDAAPLLCLGRRRHGRSRLLTHWTGRDIAVAPSAMTEGHRREYAERLKDILGHGLWMTQPGETLTSSVQGNEARIQLRCPMTCFTELRLSSSHSHVQRYGLLGVVVDRLFVLERLGAPVHYVRQHHAEALVGNLAQLTHWIHGLKGKDADAEQMQHAAMFAASFLKGMSHPSTDDFAFLDEHEWRIVQTDSVVSAGRIVATGLPHPCYRVPVAVGDVRLLVVPDEIVRMWTVSAPWFASWADGRAVPIHTVNELEDF
jgi:hypothetical protein